jgi:hypothetical protein
MQITRAWRALREAQGGMMRNYRLAALLAIFAASAGHAQSLDQQERCANQAKRSFQEIQARDLAEQKQIGVGQRASADYQSHYYTKTSNCLMLVETTDMLAGTQSNTAYLIDANERRQYATYVWMSRKDKKYWEVPPTACELVPSLREKKSCKAREEFDAFVAEYMEEPR